MYVHVCVFWDGEHGGMRTPIIRRVPVQSMALVLAFAGLLED